MRRAPSPGFTIIELVIVIAILAVMGAIAMPKFAAFTSEGTTFAMYLTTGIGILGFVLRRYGYPLIPVLLGLILGPMLESNLRRSLILSQGDPTVFLRSPIAAMLLLAAAAFPLWMLRRRRSVGRTGAR